MIPVYPIGAVDWLTTQTLYHGIAELGEEAVVLCWPTSPYVSLGCHQDGDEFDPSSKLPALRRRVGGSLVYLDDQQVFFQVILNPSRFPDVRRPMDWYRLALNPVVNYLADLGLRAELNPPADILVNGRKVSGNAGGQIDDRMVIVGNLLLDFPRDMMVQARYAPHPRLKEAFATSLDEHLMTLRQLVSDTLTPTAVMEGLTRHFADAFSGQVMPAPWDRWSATLAVVGQELQDPEWLRAPGMRLPFHQIKVREGVYLRMPRVSPKDPRASIVAEVHTDEDAIHRLWGLETWHTTLSLPLTRKCLEEKPGPKALKSLLNTLLGAHRQAQEAPLAT